MKPIHAPTHLYFYSVDRVVAVKRSHLKKVDFDTYTGSRIELGFLFLTVNRGMSKKAGAETEKLFYKLCQFTWSSLLKKLLETAHRSLSWCISSQLPESSGICDVCFS